MKTYSRKKSEGDEEIIDLNDICRLCMGKEDELIPIFSSEDSIPLTLRIMACVALEVFEGDGLPDKICNPCKFQLEKSYNFRKKCEQSDMKLRVHLKELRESSCEEEELMDTRENSEEQEKLDKDEVEPSTEEDLVGVTKVTYIQTDQEQENVQPESITLPLEQDETIKEACTLKDSSNVKTEEDFETEEHTFVINESQSVLNEDMNAIADAVKATLAAQTDISLAGQLQMKINPSTGKSTQVEVTLQDGSVILMELVTEDEDGKAKEGSSIEAEVDEEGEMKIFQCPHCPKSFSRKIQLRRHASVHMQQRGFSCGICEKWFPTRSALLRHERIHTGERPFQCEVCQKSFAQKEILFRHLITHTGQRPYSCPHCGKGFSQKEPLRVHMRTHSSIGSEDIQLHYCSVCPKVFCHASGLSRHLVTHTGKQFKCRHCEKQFTDKSSLRRHGLQTNHL
ncbi:unnamed protein product [Acanthoscelides obtectus]|uniref:Uncharacterized protein n=1 Tax=Acanthoscelides obtectus TaxID=200917 RepID=A0A9P0LR14_ACAOB|nr:unnamed protein product [Acanthoscelides obtectus]CAK1633307.1 Zinc finger and SCAN domain-containing protein 32 [Acanthoscelides obtectus]